MDGPSDLEQTCEPLLIVANTVWNSRHGENSQTDRKSGRHCAIGRIFGCTCAALWNGSAHRSAFKRISAIKNAGTMAAHRARSESKRLSSGDSGSARL